MTCFIATPTCVSAWNGTSPSEHLVEQHSERVNVGPRVDRLSHRLLGGDVIGRAEHRPVDRRRALRLEQRAIPKSVTLARPSGSISTFCGLTSPCTRLRACAVARPRPTSIAYAADSSREGGRAGRSAASASRPRCTRTRCRGGHDPVPRRSPRRRSGASCATARASRLNRSIWSGWSDISAWRTFTATARWRVLSSAVHGRHAAASEFRLEAVAT